MLIRNAEIFGSSMSGCQDVRLVDDHIEQIGTLTPRPGETVLQAAGGALLPGLHDHHIHLLSYAASLNSVRCGPPDVHDEAALIDVLQTQSGSGWLRGYGYHESVAGEIDRRWLDAHLSKRPVRIQHRSGRLWVLNSAALDLLRQPDGGTSVHLPEDGRCFDADAALGDLLGRVLPPIEEASQRLARYGVTGITDMTPGNDAETLGLFSDPENAGRLIQKLYLAGAPELPYPSPVDGIVSLATKIHLHDSALPEFDALCDTIRVSHAIERPIAVHCVTEVELVFALAAIEEAGVLVGDRIEHASIAPPALVATMADLGLTVVTQPNFIAERGDAYLRDLAPEEQAWLYRARGFKDQGIPLAGGTDAPFGSADPWIAIRAAVERRTAGGKALGSVEALTPEEAVALFLGTAEHPASPRRLEAGRRADLCLLDRPWRAARLALSSAMVQATICAGRLI